MIIMMMRRRMMLNKKNKAVGYKIYPHTDQPRRHRLKTASKYIVKNT
jgi:hypothetical protein